MNVARNYSEANVNAYSIIRASGPGIGSHGRVTVEHPTDAVSELTYDRTTGEPDGTWYLWWMSTYGHGHGVAREDVTDPDLYDALERAWTAAIMEGE